MAIGLTGALLGTVLTLGLAGAGDDPVGAPTALPPAAAPPQASAPVGAPTAPAAGPVVVEPTPPVTADVAGRIAAEHVGGTVDTVEPESGDHGAAWDVDVYAPDGEYTVYVSGSGDVVHVDGPFRD